MKVNIDNLTAEVGKRALPKVLRENDVVVATVAVAIAAAAGAA